ncbi:uncharacterized protein Dmoj_GI18559 [Drosophila mojavensis]|uniref:Gustatory receptor n=2 Tax=Drosophila mojavensis TaxID=7230 RepID=B4KRG4_DROMO|nr:uncharacterized protein Dmoj_GI18559 [Drosophila mojavensis]
MQQPGTRRGDGFVYCYDSLYRLLFYLGILTFRLHNQSEGGPRSTRLRVLYALAARAAILLGFVGGVYVKLTDPQMSQAMFSQLSPLFKIIFFWECILCILTYVEHCLCMDAYCSKHIGLLASMQLLDTDISAEFPHVQWRYNRTRSKYWYGSSLVFCLYVAISLALMFDTTQCSCGYVSTILIASTYSMLTSMLGTMGFIHIALMDYLRIRFRLIMKLVEQQYAKADTSPKANEEQLQHMDHLFEFTKRCSRLLDVMNDVCGFISGAGIFYDFTHMTCFVYMLCHKLLHRESWDTQYTFVSLHLVVHIYKLLMTSVYGYLLQREKRNCLQLLSNYAHHFGNQATLKNAVESFQLWRMHNNDSAHIGYSFPCNISLNYLVFNALANYVIVLVQLLFQLQLKDKQGQPIRIPKDSIRILAMQYNFVFNSTIH